MAEAGDIHAHLRPQFNIRDIDPVDLADFLPGLTREQASLLRDYAHIENLYEVLLAATRLGSVDKRDWYSTFPGLFEPTKPEKKIIADIEKQLEQDDRNQLTDEEREKLHGVSGGTKPGVLERAIGHIKRFCTNPYFGGSATGPQILAAPSCVDDVLSHLGSGKFVFIDMRGRSDEDYTMIAALFARRLLTENKGRTDAEQIRACIVMEEAHNILSEEELSKGTGNGSVFIELAREGRSYKLGFVLVTQQPDARSIALQVVKTIDTVMAFNMPPDDAKHLQRLKSAFADLELQIANAAEFKGVAVSDAGPVHFQSMPVDDGYMRACSDHALEKYVLGPNGSAPTSGHEPEVELPPPSVEERLALLMRRRQLDIQPVALATMRQWNGANGKDDADVP
jgi:hypothetical protein